MLSLLTGRTYIIIAVVVGLLLFGLSLIDPGGSVADVFTNLGNDARNAGLAGQIVSFVVFPLEFVFSGELAGIIVGALLWPLAFVWLILVVLMVVISFMLPLLGQFNAAF